MKYLGLDLGTKTLGLAMSDRSGLISSPYKVLRYSNYDELISQLLLVINSEKVEYLVLGMPKNMNNSMGSRANETMVFLELLKDKINIPIDCIDERLSTVEAEKYLISSNMRREDRKKVIDSVAASIILDTYLERAKNGKDK